VEILKLSYNN